MTDPEERLGLHDQFYALMLDTVRGDQYPSTQMLDLLEQTMLGHERVELAHILIEKISQDRYPSIMMLHRLARIIGPYA
jgi:hypothetical protein